MKIIVFIFLGLFYVNYSIAQEVLEEEEPMILYNEFGMNMTGLLNQLLPFKAISNKTGPYNISLKVVRDQNAFRLGVGMHILTDEVLGGGEDIINFNMRLGFERRNTVNPKVNFYQIFDLMLMAGNFNSPINDFSDNENAGAGIGLGLGIEYMLLENLSLSTEGVGFAGVVGGSASIFSATFIPPVAIFLNYKF